jgi:hypothetical protein
MCGEAVAVARVFGVFDDQAFVLGDLKAADPSHQLSAARVQGQVRPARTPVHHHSLVAEA